MVQIYHLDLPAQRQAIFSLGDNVQHHRDGHRDSSEQQRPTTVRHRRLSSPAASTHLDTSNVHLHSRQAHAQRRRGQHHRPLCPFVRPSSPPRAAPYSHLLFAPSSSHNHANLALTTLPVCLFDNLTSCPSVPSSNLSPRPDPPTQPNSTQPNLTQNGSTQHDSNLPILPPSPTSARQLSPQTSLSPLSSNTHYPSKTLSRKTLPTLDLTTHHRTRTPNTYGSVKATW